MIPAITLKLKSPAAFGRLCRAALLVFVAAVPVSSQDVHAGMKLGVPLTQYFNTGAVRNRNVSAEYSAATRRYTVGISAEWRLTDAFGLELDAMYHRMGYVGIVHYFSFVGGDFSDRAIDVKGNSWDFPLMAKYRLRWRARPYVAGGGVLRYVGPVRGRGEATTGSLVTGTSVTSALDTAEPSELSKRFYPGLIVAGGLEMGRGHFRLLPEIRCTRWTANISGDNELLGFAPNQVEFLVGVLF